MNDLINNPPDPTQLLPEGLGSGLQALTGGHGQSLQSLLASAHSNPQLLEQLLTSGALSPLPPGMFEGLRYCSHQRGRRGRREGGLFLVLFVASPPVVVGGVGDLPAVLAPPVPVRVGGGGAGLPSRHPLDHHHSSSRLGE